MSTDRSVTDKIIIDDRQYVLNIKNFIYSKLVYSQTDMLSWNLMQSGNSYQMYLYVQALKQQKEK